MELQDRIRLPAAHDEISGTVHVRTNEAAAAKRQGIGDEAVEQVRDVLIATAVIGARVIGVLEEEMIVPGLGQIGVGIAILREEAGGVPEAFGIRVVGLELKAVA